MANIATRQATRRDPYVRAMDAFAVSYMSDAKWYKTFRAIAGAGLKLSRAIWKFIESDRRQDWPVPELKDISQHRLVDGKFLPVEYKWIEWIRFPHTWRRNPKVPLEIAQDVRGLSLVLDSVGKLKVSEDAEGLTIYGYGRKSNL